MSEGSVSISNRRFVAEEKKQAFLCRLTEFGEVKKAAKQSDADQSALYKERKRDPEFAKAWAEALETRKMYRLDRAEDALFKRAVDGWTETVYFQGRNVGRIRKYDGSLLKFLLEAENPQKYRQNHKIEQDMADIRDAAQGILEALNETVEKSEEVFDGAGSESECGVCGLPWDGEDVCISCGHEFTGGGATGGLCDTSS